MKRMIRAATLVTACIAILASSLTGASAAHADDLPDPNAVVTSYSLQVDAVDLVSGVVTTELFDSPASAFNLGGLPVDGLAVAGCRPGGVDLYGTITAKNVFGNTVWKFHDDTQFYYNCTKVTSVPFNNVYGTDTKFAYTYKGTQLNQRVGVGTPYAQSTGVGHFCQEINYGFGSACVQNQYPKINWKMYANGSWSAAGK